MSLMVGALLIDQAERNQIDEAAFVESIRQSLPYAWGIVEQLAHTVDSQGADWADHAVAPPSEQARGQLLRMVGGDAIRGAVERHFQLKLAFQNCHRLAVFRPEALESEIYRDFVSVRSQILNQTPEMRDC
ncbi:SCO5389 family protein [Nodosilinea sp. E11]|uniref:SCO5389 family protein n=1 Tax=Nodosilinea sp. E11 TaxID=3037479 RepID=UPI0029350390|nr:SCO5389 family protein [Nodosilinea sp. E11]WOD40094.1 SCO5389 family protein [Nodosilinea sp. E11]